MNCIFLWEMQGFILASFLATSAGVILAPAHFFGTYFVAFTTLNLSFFPFPHSKNSFFLFRVECHLIYWLSIPAFPCPSFSLGSRLSAPSHYFTLSFDARPLAASVIVIALFRIGASLWRRRRRRWSTSKYTSTARQ